MYRFADQIEFRVDRRQILFFVMGGVVWTLIAFFFGMLAAGGKQSRPLERKLAALGWLDREANSFRSSKITFAAPPKSSPTHIAKLTPKKERNTLYRRNVRAKQPLHAPTHQPLPPLEKRRKTLRKKQRKRRKPPKKRRQQTSQRYHMALQRALQPSDNRNSKQPQHLTRLLLGQKHTPTRKKPRKKTKKPSPNAKQYTVSLRLPKERRRVMRIFRRLQQRGYQPIIAKVSTIHGPRYRITIGRFYSKRKAYALARKIRRQTKLSSVLRITR